MLSNPSEQRSSDAGIARLTQAILDVPLHALVLLEVFGDEICGLVRTDAELLRESKRSLAVHDTEVHRLRTGTLRRCDRADRKTQHGGCGSPVNVLTGRKGFGQPLVSRKVSENSKLDLGIVGGHEPKIGRASCRDSV